MYRGGVGHPEKKYSYKKTKKRLAPKIRDGFVYFNFLWHSSKKFVGDIILDFWHEGEEPDGTEIVKFGHWQLLFSAVLSHDKEVIVIRKKYLYIYRACVRWAGCFSESGVEVRRGKIPCISVSARNLPKSLLKSTAASSGPVWKHRHTHDSIKKYWQKGN